MPTPRQRVTGQSADHAAKEYIKKRCTKREAWSKPVEWQCGMESCERREGKKREEEPIRGQG